MHLPQLRPRQPFLGLALAAVAAIFVADRWQFASRELLLGSAVLGVWTFLQPRTWLCIAVTFATFLSLHTLRHHGSDAARLAQRFEAGPQPLRATGVVWSEPEMPRTASRWTTCSFRLRLEQIEIAGASQPVSALVHVRWAGQPPVYGDRVACVGSGVNLSPVRNPGQFDAAAYQRRQGMHSEIRTRHAADCAILAHDEGSPALAFAIKARRWTKAQLERDLEDAPEIVALIESMVLGLRGETPDDVKELFQRTGTLHLFAVSGLNVAMLASIVWFALKPLQIGRAAAVVMIVPMLAAYALLTGLSASCVRASVMGSLILAGHLAGRPPVHWNSLAASALLILGWDTNQLFSPGFQFSFVLVGALIFLTGRIERRIEPFVQIDPFLPRPLWSWRQVASIFVWKKFAGALAVTFAAWVGSLLFTAGYFHLFSPASIFANLIAVPLAFGVLALGLATVFSSSIAPSVAALFNNANWLCAKGLLESVRLFAAVPGGHLYVETPRFRAPPACELTVLDAGSGAAIHLRIAGGDWLIDCGQGFTYDRIVLPYLRTRGVNRLAGFVLTHGDAQHIGAAELMLEDFAPRIIVDSPLKDRSKKRRDFHDCLAQRRHGKCIARRGDCVALGAGAKLHVLFPPAGIERSVADDRAFVLMLEASGRRALFMSDSGFNTEQWLLKNEPDLRADVLVKGHHGRDLSGTPDFLARVAPQVIVCTAPDAFGAGPVALDPWAEEVRQRGIALFRQEQSGAVRVEFDRGEMRASGFVDGQTFRSRAR